MAKVFQGYSRSFVKSPDSINTLSTPDTVKTYTPLTSTNSSHFSKSHKTNYDLSRLQSPPQVTEFLSKFTPSYHIRANSKGQAPGPKSPLKSSLKTKNPRSQQPREAPKDSYLRINYCPPSKKNNPQQYQQSTISRQLDRSPPSHGPASKRAINQTKNASCKQNPPKNGQAAEHMTPDKSNKGDNNLEKLRANFSVLEIHNSKPFEPSNRGSVIPIMQQDNNIQLSKTMGRQSYKDPQGRMSLQPSEQITPKNSIQTELRMSKPNELDARLSLGGNDLKGNSVQEATSASSAEGTIKEKDRASLVQPTHSDIYCINHLKKKAKYYEVDAESNSTVQRPFYYCSECAVKVASKNREIQKLPASSFRLTTEDSQDEESSFFEEEEELNESKQVDVTAIIDNFKAQNKPNTNRREEEIKTFLQNVRDTTRKIPSLEEQTQADKNQLHSYLSSTNEKIQIWTAKMITILQEQAENIITSLNVEFSKEMVQLAGFSESLKSINRGLHETIADIEVNYKKILNDIEEEPYQMIMGRYDKRLSNFDKLLGNIKNRPKDTTKFLPSEKLSHFKRRLKTVINEAFSESLETNIDYEATNQHQGRFVNSPPLPEIKTLGQFEDFLRSEESKDVLKAKPAFPNNVFISFENKDIFENALQSSVEAITTVNFTQDSQLNTLTSNVFVSEPDDLGNPLFIDALKTSNLNLNLGRGLNDEVSSFSEDTYADYRNHSMSSQALSGGSSLNKYVHLLDKVNQKQSTRNYYLKMGSLYDLGRKGSQVYDHAGFLNFIENKLKDERVRETCQKSLFQSPAFKEMTDDAMLY